MRVAVGSVLVLRAGFRLWAEPPLNIAITSAILLTAGILLTIGLWTPVVGTVIAVVEVWKMLTLPGDKWLWLLLAAASGALAMLGPGRWSIDARLFGWKRVVAPHRKNSSNYHQEPPPPPQMS
jgi:hypothetical protein